MSTSAERREGLLRKVRGLIDTADSYESKGQSEAAQSYRNKADNLMTMYAIEEFELAMAGDNAKQSPEVRDYEYGEMPREMVEPMTQIFYRLAEHCRCKIGYWGYHRSKIVGYPADLEYLDVMFTGIRMHLSANVRPQPSKEMGYEASLALLKESGMKWKDIYLRLLPVFPERFKNTVANVANMKKDRSAWDGEDYAKVTQFEESWIAFQERYPQHDRAFWLKDNGLWIEVDGEVYQREIPRAIGVRFTKEYTEFCQAEGRERVYSDPKVWVRSFTEAYQWEILRRLREMKASTSEATTGKELVLKSIYDDLLEFYYQNFPDKRPHDPDCQCDSCHLCSDPKCQRPRCKERRKPVRYRSIPEKAVSAAASRRGAAAAANADLTGRDRRVGSSERKGLPS